MYWDDFYKTASVTEELQSFAIFCSSFTSVPTFHNESAVNN